MESGDRKDGERLRIDKWLWAARFFKTRGLAAEAVDGGKVHVNGQRVKPAREVKPGDELDIQAVERWVVRVQGIAAQRRPAAEARQLYQETPESVAARVAQAEARKFALEPTAELHGRPTKRDRRRLERLG